jgi:protein TonB
MFEDSLVESSGQLSRRDPRTMALSLAMQIAIGGILVLVPLIYTQALPEQHLLHILEAPSPPVAVAPQPHNKPVSAKSVSQFDNGHIRLPMEIPKNIAIVNDVDTAPSGLTAVADSIPGAIPGTGDNNALANLIRTVPATLPKVAAQKIRVSSGVAQGLLIRQVAPQYPQLARQARIQGMVVLQAAIGRDGTVQGLHVISGHPMLTQAAMEAVKQWSYRPYSLNGEPVEVDTQINVNFTLGGG